MFLWCARFASQRSACADIARSGLVRINRQPTDKPHARVRPGDVLTLPLRGGVRVVRVLALSGRRGGATEARALYEEVENQEGPGGNVPFPPDPPSSI
jgi:ribosome-associated heat shock protein Hsp15